LLRAVCDEFWLVGRGGVAPFEGDLDDYQRYLLEEAKRLRESLKESDLEPVSPAASATSGESLNPKLQRKVEAQRRAELSQKTQPLRRELLKVESDMEALNAERTALETQLTQPMPAAEIAQAGRRLKAVSDQLEALEERWLTLTDQIEQATA